MDYRNRNWINTRSNKKMNILYITNSWSFSPTHASAVTTYEIIKRLVKKRHKVTVLVPSTENARNIKHASIEPILLKNVKVVTSGPFSFNFNEENLISGGLTCTIWHLPLILKALALKRKTNYQAVISMYHPTHLATFSGFIISRILKVPLIVKVHDLIPDITDPNIFRRIYKKSLFKLCSKFLKKGSLILVPSSEWVNLLEKVYGMSKDKIVLLPNGVDAIKFNVNVDCDYLRRTLGLENKKVILFIGKFFRVRGLECLIKAMPNIVEKEPNARLILLGEGSEKRKIIDLSRHLKIGDFVMLMSEVEHDAVPAYISLADVAIGPLTGFSISMGTMPIKVIEYMACGKPIVGCFNGAAKDLIIDGYNGLLISPEDVDQLSSAIIRLLLDDNLAKRLGMNARKHVEAFFDWNVITEKLEKTLEAVARKHMQG